MAISKLNLPDAVWSCFPNGCGCCSVGTACAPVKGVFCSARNEVFGLKSAHALSDCRIVGFTQSCVDGSLNFEVGSDQEFPLSSCFTTSSAELIKIW